MPESVLNLFTPTQCRSYGRCLECGFHPLQGHRDTCPNRKAE